MATKITINGRSTSIPNIYSTITSGIINPPSPLDFGNVLIIDDGSLMDGVSGAIGVNGTNAQGVNSIYSFNTLQQFRALVKDGPLYQAALPLFAPSSNGISGVNSLFYIKAATTGPASVTATFTKGTIAATTNEEGTIINGVLSPQTYDITTIAVPASITISPSTSGGTLPAGAHFYVVTALNANGETIASAEVTTVNTGSTSSNLIGWGAVTGASGYRVYRGTVTGLESVYYTASGTSYTDTNAAVTGTATPPTNNSAIKGTTLSNNLFTGYGFRLERGKSFGYSLVFYQGVSSDNFDTYNTSVDTYWDGTLVPNNNAVSGVYGRVLSPKILFRSPDLTGLRQIQTWAAKSADVKGLFKSFVVTFTGANQLDDSLYSGDVSQYTALAPYTLLAGGTETFGSLDFDAAITAVTGVDHTFFLALGSGDNSQSVNNLKIFNLLTSGDLKYDKYMIVGGGYDYNAFIGSINDSCNVAQSYNSQHVIVVHAGGQVANAQQPKGFLTVSQFFKASNVLGRLCGLEPQTPVTFKNLLIDSDLHILTESDKQTAIDNGVTYTNYDSELNSFVVGYGLTTLQDNEFLVNNNGDSYDIAVERIKSQLNKSIIVNAKRALFGGNSGPNRNTVSPESLKTWLTGFLNQQIAKPTQDNLIIRWANIVITVNQDTYHATYEFVPNFPLSKLIFTGIMLDK